MIEIRTQCIQPENTNILKRIVITHEFNKPSQELIERKGVLLGLFDIETSESFDLESALKLLIDNIEKDFYKDIAQTPIKSLELSLHNAIMTLGSFRNKSDTGNFTDFDSSINISLAVIWNQILYIANIGKNASYLVRGSGARDLYDEKTEFNEITSNSILIEDEDVLILGSKVFAEMYTSKTIFDNLAGMSARLTSGPEKNSCAVILIKIGYKTEIKKAKFNKKKIDITKLIEKFSVYRKFLSKKSTLADKFKPYQNKKSAPILSITDNSAIQRSQNVNISKPKRILSPSKGKNTKLIIGGIILSLVLISTYIIYTLDPINNEQMSTNNNPNTISANKPEVEETDTPQDEIKNPKAKKLLSDLYDNEDYSIDHFIKTSKSIIYYIKSKKELISIDIATKTKKTLMEKIDDIDQIKCYEKLCIVNSDNVISVFNPLTPEKVDKYQIEQDKDLYDIAYYADKLYLLTPTDVLTITIGEKSPNPIKWLKKDQVFSNPKYLEADSSLYIIDGVEIQKFSSGVKQSFGYKPIENSDLNNIWISTKSLYTYDKFNNTIIVIEKNTGKISKTINLLDFDFSSTEEIKSVYVDTVATKIVAIILYQNTFYEIEL